MAQQLLAPAAGNGRASAEFTLTEATLLWMTGHRRKQGARARVQAKLADGTFRTIATFRGATLEGVIPAGTYKIVASDMVGVERA